jgi:hypothetical protein
MTDYYGAAQCIAVASRSLSSGAHSRDPLARNDEEGSPFTPPHTTTLSRFAARVMPV